MELKSNLRVAVLASFALAGAAMAQTPPADQAQTPAPAPAAEAGPAAATAAPDEATGRKKASEEIFVTGTRVRRKDLTTPAPITVISREQLQSSSVANIGDFLQQLPEQGNATNTQVNNGGDGETQISLRSLGAQRTLVLVDGKRFVAGGSGATSVVDLNSIPNAAIERIEILKDGASAIYGSDALGGVVNIITRRKMNGVEASAFAGTSQHGDGTVYDLSLIGGTSNENGSFIFGAGYYNQDLYFAGARDWAKYALQYDYNWQDDKLKDPTTCVPGSPKCAVGHGGSTAIPAGRVNSLNPGTCAPADSAFDPTLGPGSALCSSLVSTFGATKRNWIHDPGASACVGDQSATPTSGCQTGGWRPFNNASDKYNYQAVNYLVTPSQRYQFFANGDFHISDFARIYSQATFVNRQSSTLLAPEPLFIINDGITLARDNVYNPFGRDLGDVRRRLVELSGRFQGYDLDTVRVVAGIDGTLPEALGPLKGWYWDTSFVFGRNWGDHFYRGSLNTQLTGNGLGPTHPDPTLPGGYGCGTAAAPITTPFCTPVNLFDKLTPDMIASLGGYEGIDRGWNQQSVVEVNLSGDLFNIAADRPAGLALGFQHRNEWGGFIPNAISQLGLDTDFNGQPTQGHYYVNEGYGELIIPIVNHVDFFEELEAQAAARVYSYNSFGSGATYKFGGRWRPVRDVTIRGTFSTGFRAPAVPELYSGQGPNFPSATDPCDTTNTAYQGQCGYVSAAKPGAWNNQGGLGQIPETIGGNTKLQPEKATIITAGVVLEPSFARGLSLTVDYYNIKVTNALGAIGAAAILHACYPGPGATPDPSACALVSRDSSGVLTNLTDITTNQGDFTSSGVDVALQYSLPTDFGRFLARVNSNFLIAIDATPYPNTVIHGKGNYDLGVNPGLKFNAGINYYYEGFTAGVLGRFIGPFTECADSTGVASGAGVCSFKYFSYNDTTKVSTIFPSHQVPAEMTFDVNVGYRLKNPTGVTSLLVGVRNLLNTNPVTVYDSFLTYADASAYDFAGRYVYFRATQSF
jgi:outer membrane receptor protein involved in Fe transport